MLVPIPHDQTHIKSVTNIVWLTFVTKGNTTQTDKHTCNLLYKDGSLQLTPSAPRPQQIPKSEPCPKKRERTDQWNATDTWRGRLAKSKCFQRLICVKI